jgi:hypothetical protein
MGVAGTVVAAAMLGAPAVQAAPSPAPDPGTQAAPCGHRLEEWQPARFVGTQYHDNDKAKASAWTDINFYPKKVSWSMSFGSTSVGAHLHDDYWLSGPGTVEFYSDRGTGKGEFWRFRLTAVKCGTRRFDEQIVTHVTVDSYIPSTPFLFTNPTTHYGTAAGHRLMRP